MNEVVVVVIPGDGGRRTRDCAVDEVVVVVVPRDKQSNLLISLPEPV